ncbi:hypothetical protein AMS68_006245 [Peltaster fructicola]|uniref:Uncharacterized protein n=1 Tax=Peltaster fructicola TaxID=286661 RepID=A0A6H0Y1J6_9PEZI|nr:hypothetical protein AMS68_006245 [Peltaster fructicola]
MAKLPILALLATVALALPLPQDNSILDSLDLGEVAPTGLNLIFYPLYPVGRNPYIQKREAQPQLDANNPIIDGLGRGSLPVINGIETTGNNLGPVVAPVTDSSAASTLKRYINPFSGLASG